MKCVKKLIFSGLLYKEHPREPIIIIAGSNVDGNPGIGV